MSRARTKELRDQVKALAAEHRANGKARDWLKIAASALGEAAKHMPRASRSAGVLTRSLRVVPDGKAAAKVTLAAAHRDRLEEIAQRHVTKAAQPMLAKPPARKPTPNYSKSAHRAESARESADAVKVEVVAAKGPCGRGPGCEGQLAVAQCPDCETRFQACEGHGGAKQARAQVNRHRSWHGESGAKRRRSLAKARAASGAKASRQAAARREPEASTPADTADASRLYRCQAPIPHGARGETVPCSGLVTGAKLSQHVWDVHHRAVSPDDARRLFLPVEEDDVEPAKEVA